MAVKKKASVPKRRFVTLGGYGFLEGEFASSIDGALAEHHETVGDISKSGVNVYELVLVGKYTGKMVSEKVG